MADIDTLALSIRAINCIKRFGISTVEELQERMAEFENHAPKFAKEAKAVLETRERVMSITPKYKLGEWVNTDMVSAQLSFEELCSMVGQTIAITATSTGSRCIIVNVQEISDDGNSRGLIYDYGLGELTGLISESDFKSGKRKAYRLIGSPIENEPEAQKTEASIVLSESYEKAVSLHRRIAANAHSAQESLLEVCKGLKEMRDGKLYAELGYESFEDYAENEVGMSRRNANRYIKIAEMYESGTPVSPTIGATKLYLLSTLSDEDRQEITEKNDVKKLGKRELETKIADLKKANERLMVKVDEAEKKAQKSHERETDAWGKAGRLETDNEFYKMKIQQLEAENKKKNDDIISLEETIEKLESRPVEVAVKETDSEELEKLRAEYEAKLAEAVKPDAVPDLQKVFEAYYSAALSSMEKLVAFVEENNIGAYIQRTADFLAEFEIKVGGIEWIN